MRQGGLFETRSCWIAVISLLSPEASTLNCWASDLLVCYFDVSMGSLATLQRKNNTSRLCLSSATPLHALTRALTF